MFFLFIPFIFSNICPNHWIGPNCTICPANFDIEKDCNACANRWTGSNCSICPPRVNKKQNCLGCENEWKGPDCSLCYPPNIAKLGCIKPNKNTKEVEILIVLVITIALLGFYFLVCTSVVITVFLGLERKKNKKNNDIHNEYVVIQ